MIIEKTYKILITLTNEIHTFTTCRTEKEFYKTLDAVYGAGNYITLEIA